VGEDGARLPNVNGDPSIVHEKSRNLQPIGAEQRWFSPTMRGSSDGMRTSPGNAIIDKAFVVRAQQRSRPTANGARELLQLVCIDRGARSAAVHRST
jgi:hypothetical protein